MTTNGGPFSLSRVGTRKFERYLVRIVGVFGFLYATQTTDSLVARWPVTPHPVLVASALFGVVSVLIGLAAAFVPRHSKRIFRAAVGAFLLALLIWPFGIHSSILGSPMPWFVAMWPCEAAFVAFLSAGVVVPLLVSLGGALYVCVVLSAIGHLDLSDVCSNGLFMAASSGVLLLLVRSVRQGVAHADAAQDAALGEYSRSRVDAAAEAERVRTDALVHDSVITTFLAAAEARTPDSEVLSRRMAANALRVLRHVNRTADMGPGLPFRIAFTTASPELAHLLPRFQIRQLEVENVILPTTANDALIGAMAEAMANSVAHAGPVTRRTIEMTELGADGIRIVITDDGVGFTMHDATAARLGVSVSIIERLRRVDGRADVRSAPGMGTTVTLSWGSVVISGTAPLADETLGVVPA